MCPVNDDIKDAEHFFLLCNSFKEQRHNFLAGINDVPVAYEYSENSDITYLHFEANNFILNLTIVETKKLCLKATSFL